MNVSDFTLSACFPEARLDLSAEDNVIALALAGYPTRPYAELIRSDIPGPSNLRSARSFASRSLPAAALGSSPIGLTAATPTRGEILVHLGAAPWKPRNVKRKKPSSTEEDRPVSAKVHKLGASPTVAIPEPCPTRLANPNRNPRDARFYFFLFFVLLNFCFQKCHDPKPRLDPVGGSKPEPGLLRHFQLSLSKHLACVIHFIF